MLESLLIGERFYAFRCSPAFNWSVYVFQDDTVSIPRLDYTGTGSANLSRGVVVRLDLSGAPVAPQALARLNAFLHTPGFSKGFRGWRRELEAQDAGVVLWKSAAAWQDLLGIIGANQPS